MSDHAWGLRVRSCGIRGDGSEEHSPLPSGDTLEINCEIDLNADEVWTSCEFTHQLRDKENREAEVFCYSTPEGKANCGKLGDGRVNNKNIDFVTSQRSCGITIKNSDFQDNGLWTIHVSSPTSTSKQTASIDVYIAVSGDLYISEPDTINSNNAEIEFDASNRQSRIESTCRAYNTFPVPKFRWFVNKDDDRYEIDTTKRNKDVDLGRMIFGRDSENGEYVEQTFQWTPNNLCQDFHLERECENEQFSFNLICKMDQDNYFRNENSDKSTDVYVKIFNNESTTLYTSLVMILLLSYMTFLLS